MEDIYIYILYYNTLYIHIHHGSNYLNNKKVFPNRILM